MRRPAAYFSSVLKKLSSTYLPKNKIICSTGWYLSLRHHISSQTWSQSSKEKKQGRPYETSCSIFFISFKQIVINISPKKLNLIQYRLIFVIQAPYLIIKVITKFWKCPRDVLIRRPAKYFSSVLRLLSTYLLKNQIICSTGWYLSLRHRISSQKWSQSSEEKNRDVLMRRPAA